MLVLLSIKQHSKRFWKAEHGSLPVWVDLMVPRFSPVYLGTLSDLYKTNLADI